MNSSLKTTYCGSCDEQQLAASFCKGCELCEKCCDCVQCVLCRKNYDDELQCLICYLCPKCCPCSEAEKRQSEDIRMRWFLESLPEDVLREFGKRVLGMEMED